MILHGTRPVRKDHRNYSFNRTFGAVIQLPDEYNVDAGFGFPDQNAEGYPFGCTGYTQSELCQDQDATHYRPSYTYDQTRSMEGTGQQLVGCTIEDSLKSTIVWGVLGTDETTVDQAGYHRRAQYFQVEPVSTDFFDAIRQALYLNSVEKRSVSCGTPWFREWETAPAGILHDFIFRGDEPWHNWKISGWKMIAGQPYLIGKSWQGTHYGDGGYHYVSRTICNKVFALSGTGAFTVRKATAADIQTIRLDIIGTILSYMRLWIHNLVTMPPQPSPEPQNTPVDVISVPATTTDAPTVPESETKPPALSFATPKEAWHAVRVHADMKGLSLAAKNILCACIFQESRFDNSAKHENKDTHGNVLSTDYGIVQINDYYHTGPGKDFPSAAYVVANPGEAVDFMIDMQKAGKLDQWVSYSSSAYKQWLAPNSPMWTLAVHD